MILFGKSGVSAAQQESFGNFMRGIEPIYASS
jgi:hypothetical protein